MPQWRVCRHVRIQAVHSCVVRQHGVVAAIPATERGQLANRRVYVRMQVSGLVVAAVPEGVGESVRRCAAVRSQSAN